VRRPQFLLSIFVSITAALKGSMKKEARILRYSQYGVPADASDGVPARFSSGNHDIDLNLWSSEHIVPLRIPGRASLWTTEVVLSTVILSFKLSVPFIDGMDSARPSLKLWVTRLIPGITNVINTPSRKRDAHVHYSTCQEKVVHHNETFASSRHVSDFRRC
jgi:hypothetical protein